MPPPPLAAHQLLIFLVQVTVLLFLALCLGRFAQWLRMPAIAGELLTGVLIGPSVLGNSAPWLARWLLPARPDQMHLLDALGQLGVLLLVGITGTRLDMVLLRRRSGSALAVSLGGLLLPLALGVVAGILMPASLLGAHGGRWIFASFLGVAMCVSAVPVIAKTLSDMGLLHRDISQLTLAAGTVDDVVGWFLLSVVSAAATVGITSRISLSVVYLVSFVGLAVLVGRPLVRGLMRLAAKSQEAGPTVVTAVIIVLCGAITTHALGMEPVFGALVMGILVGAPGAADHAKLAPLRTVVLSVLAPIFMTTAGLRMDLTALRRPEVALAGAAMLAVAVVGKFAGAYVAARLTRLSGWEAMALGAGMNARGVVQVIVATTGLRLGVLTTATYTVIVLVAIATSLMAPPLLRIAMCRVSQNEGERLRQLEHDAWTNAGAPVGATAEA